MCTRTRTRTRTLNTHTRAQRKVTLARILARLQLATCVHSRTFRMYYTYTVPSYIYVPTLIHWCDHVAYFAFQSSFSLLATQILNHAHNSTCTLCYHAFPCLHVYLYIPSQGSPGMVTHCPIITNQVIFGHSHPNSTNAYCWGYMHMYEYEQTFCLYLVHVCV